MKGFLISCAIAFAILYMAFYFINRASQEAHTEYKTELAQKEAAKKRR